MKRKPLALLILTLLLTSIGWTISSQMEELERPTGYVRSDLQLISQESKDGWSPAWTGPIQAATILAWFHEHGYSRFLRDFNEDGVIDELDTIELADIFGGGVMRADTTRGTTDAWLVVGLAQYVADLYPGEFVLKIYDEGFPEEFAAGGHGTFAPDAIPGILLRLQSEPTLEAYEYELETAEGVVVGLEESESHNTYFSGRSFLYETTQDGDTPVDLAWAEEDRFLPGHQGRILNTVATTDDRFSVDYRWGWIPVEFMVALSPRETPGFQSMYYDCPDDALAYHVTSFELGSLGGIQIEECVIREGDFDTYIWIVTNIDFQWMGCGLCYFAVANSGFTSVGHSGPPLWPFSEMPWAWSWSAPSGSCGFEPGQSAVFSVTVPGPTTDVWVPAAVMACTPPPPGPGILILDGERPPFFPVRTTGPGEWVEGECPDIELRVEDIGCSTLPDGSLKITVWPAKLENVGGAPINTEFDVIAFAPGFSGSVTTTISPPPPFEPGDVINLPSLVFVIPAAEVPASTCPIGVRVVADPDLAIAECDEGNNTVNLDACCVGGPDEELGACCLPNGVCADLTAGECIAQGGDFQGVGTSCATTECPSDEGCPDLIIEFLDRETSCDRIPSAVGAAGGWTLYATVRVTNIGDAPATSSLINVNIHSPYGLVSEWVGPLDPGEYEDVGAGWGFGPNDPPDCKIDLEAEADAPLRKVDECDETNNEASTTVSCPDCR